MRAGGHGREVRAAAAADAGRSGSDAVDRSGRRRWWLATGAEDTDVRLWECVDGPRADGDASRADASGEDGDDDGVGRGGAALLPRAVLRAHDTGVTGLKWGPAAAPARSTAPSSPRGGGGGKSRLLFSCGGRQEVLAWRVRAGVPLVGFGVALAGRAPVEGRGHEVRVTAMDVVRAAPPRSPGGRDDGEAYVVGLGHSNSVIKVFRFAPAAGSWHLLARAAYTTAALTALCFVPPTGPHPLDSREEEAGPLFLTGSTDGYLGLWRTPASESASADGSGADGDPPEPRLLALRGLNPRAATHALVLHRWRPARGRGGGRAGAEFLVVAADHSGSVSLARLSHHHHRRRRAEEEGTDASNSQAAGEEDEEEEGEEEGEGEEEREEEGPWHIGPPLRVPRAHAAAALGAVVLDGGGAGAEDDEGDDGEERADDGAAAAAAAGGAGTRPRAGEGGRRRALLLSAGADMALRAWSAVRPPPPPAARTAAACACGPSHAASAVADPGGAAPLPRPSGGAARRPRLRRGRGGLAGFVLRGAAEKTDKSLLTKWNNRWIFDGTLCSTVFPSGFTSKSGRVSRTR